MASGGKLYRLLCGAARAVKRPMKTVWDVPYDGEPCVFCPNHDRAWGPIAMQVWFELRETAHPWYNAGVIDRKGLPAYVRNDNWWNPKSRLAPLYNATIPYLASWILPPVMRSVPGIPVYYDAGVTKTFRKSLEVLRSGENLVIFAQFPDGYESHSEHLSKGFLLIGAMAAKRLNMALKFYPVHIERKTNTIHVMAPVTYDPERSHEEQEPELLEKLEAGIWD